MAVTKIYKGNYVVDIYAMYKISSEYDGVSFPHMYHFAQFKLFGRSSNTRERQRLVSRCYSTENTPRLCA